MLQEISIFKVPYKGFLKFLFVKVFKSDQAAYKKNVSKLKHSTLILRAVEYLEQEHKVPVLDALLYYSFHFPNETFDKLIYHMILREFKRIDKGKTTNYIPF